MKIASLFNLVADSQDLLEFFERVETPEQLVTRIDRLKHGDNPELLLDCVQGLRAAVQEALDDTLEMSASLDDGEDEEGDLGIDAELDKIAAEAEVAEPEKPNPEPPPAEEVAKSDVTPES